MSRDRTISLGHSSNHRLSIQWLHYFILWIISTGNAVYTVCHHLITCHYTVFQGCHNTWQAATTSHIPTAPTGSMDLHYSYVAWVGQRTLSFPCTWDPTAMFETITPERQHRYRTPPTHTQPCTRHWRRQEQRDQPNRHDRIETRTGTRFRAKQKDTGV